MNDPLPPSCDVLVVGAGPAGSTAAIACASRGLDVVLAEKAAFPRPKVCGCCLNARAIGVLQRVGVLDTLLDAGAHELRSVAVHAAGRRAALRLPRGLAVSRARLDFELATRAASLGVAFHDRCKVARLEPGDDAWIAELYDRGEPRRLRATVVLVAEGLAGRLLNDTAVSPVQVRRHSRLGVGASVAIDRHHAGPGTITMAVGDGGYVGAVVLEDGRLDLAAAIDADASQRLGGPGPLVASLFEQAGVDLGVDPAALPWRGTPRLTRRRPRLADERLFVLGDAAGYVEPFTGEGMAWAMTAGVAVSPVAREAVVEWTPELAERWQRETRRLVRRRQRWCRAIAFVTRRPRLARRLVGVLGRTPGLGRPVLEAINRPDDAAAPAEDHAPCP